MRAQVLALWVCIGACGGAVGDVEVDTPQEVLRARQGLAALTALADLATPLAEAPAEPTMSQLVAAYERKMPCAEVHAVAGMARLELAQRCRAEARALSGTLTLTQTQHAHRVSQGLLIDGLEQGALGFDGQAQVSVRAQGLRVDATLVVTQAHLISEHLITATIVPGNAGVLMRGEAVLDDGRGSRNLSFEGLEVAPGACYPRAGQIKVDAQGQPTVTLRFDEPAQGSDVVQVQVGAQPATTQRLPACGTMKL